VDGDSGVPAFQPVLAEMRGRLDRWMRATRDPVLQGPVKPQPGATGNDPDGNSPNEPVRPLAPGARQRSATGTALIDFGKVRRTQGNPPAWLMSRFLDRERPVEVRARRAFTVAAIPPMRTSSSTAPARGRAALKSDPVEEEGVANAQRFLQENFC
jgi:hypothetical protein